MSKKVSEYQVVNSYGCFMGIVSLQIIISNLSILLRTYASLDVYYLLFCCSEAHDAAFFYG